MRGNSIVSRVGTPLSLILVLALLVHHRSLSISVFVNWRVSLILILWVVSVVAASVLLVALVRTISVLVWTISILIWAESVLVWAGSVLVWAESVLVRTISALIWAMSILVWLVTGTVISLAVLLMRHVSATVRTERLWAICNKVEILMNWHY